MRTARFSAVLARKPLVTRRVISVPTTGGLAGDSTVSTCREMDVTVADMGRR